MTTTVDAGFWALRVIDLNRLLARTDLGWETARVYLAVACLTVGYRKAEDVISLSQISALAHVDHRHVVRALARLAKLGLYSERKVSTRRIARSVVWPPPPVGALEGTNADGALQGTNGDSDSATVGAKGSALGGTDVSAMGSALGGTHPYTQIIYPPPRQSGGGGGEGNAEQQRQETAVVVESPYERLKRLGISARVVGSILRDERITRDVVTAKCDAYEQALRDGAKIGPGLLANSLLNGTDIGPAKAKKPAPPPRAPVKFYSYCCIVCGALVDRATQPSGWPRHIDDESQCGGALLFQPADDAERLAWAKEIRYVEGLAAERRDGSLP